MLDWTRVLAGGRVRRRARWKNWKHFEGRNDRFAEVGCEEGRGGSWMNFRLRPWANGTMVSQKPRKECPEKRRWLCWILLRLQIDKQRGDTRLGNMESLVTLPWLLFSHPSCSCLFTLTLSFKVQVNCFCDVFLIYINLKHPLLPRITIISGKILLFSLL